MRDRVCEICVARLGLILFVSVAAACGGAPLPSDHLVAAEAAIRGAREVGANATPPRAALHLQLAEEQVERAKRYISESQNERAELMLRQAQADAELAIALARNDEMRKRLGAARAKLDRMRSGGPL